MYTCCNLQHAQTFAYCDKIGYHCCTEPLYTLFRPTISGYVVEKSANAS